MRKMVILLLSFVAICNVSAQEAPIASAIRDAQQLIEHMKAFDTEQVFLFTYTVPMERLGANIEQVKQAASETDNNLKAVGAEYLSFDLGDPSELFSRPEGLFVLVPYSLRMSANGQSVQQDAFFIGCSEDGGFNWKFLDGIGTARVPIDVFLPDYAGPELPELARFPVQ